MHLIGEVLEGLEGGIEAALINFDQVKVLDRVDYRFLATVFEIAGFKPDFCKWISMMDHTPQVELQVNGKRSDITVFVFRRLDKNSVKKTVASLEQRAGAKINFDKSEGLQLGS